MSHLHLVQPSPSATHRWRSSAVPAECRKWMASVVNRGTRTLRATSTLPDAWITCRGRRHTHPLSTEGATAAAASAATTHHPEGSKQEVQQLHGAGVLNVFPQFPLQDTQSVNTPLGRPSPAP